MKADVVRLASLLDRLEAVWRAQSAPIIDSLQPGLSDDEIDALMEPTGLVLPTELRVWWGWHNGAGERDALGPGSWIFISLEVALEVRAYNLSSAPASPDPVVLPDAYWREEWLPITHRAGRRNETLYLDTAYAPGEVCPIRRQTLMWDDVMVDRASSFAELVEFWVTMIETGAFYLDSSKEYWDSNPNALSTEAVQSGLL